jgi:hypothetical protein
LPVVRPGRISEKTRSAAVPEIEVVDADGNVVELRKGQCVPDQHCIRVSTQFLDGIQRAVADSAWEDDEDDEYEDDEQDDDRYVVTDAMRQRVVDAYNARSAWLSRGMNKYRVPTPVPDDIADSEDFDHARAAYDAYKKRLGVPTVRRRRKKLPHGQPWQLP